MVKCLLCLSIYVNITYVMMVFVNGLSYSTSLGHILLLPVCLRGFTPQAARPLSTLLPPLPPILSSLDIH